MRIPYVQFRGKFSPIVPIRLKHRNGEWTEFKAYVDSGASYSIFRAEIADILELKLEDGEKAYVTVGNGSLIPVYSHQITIQLAEEEFKATIGFSKRLGIGFNILGRKDVFERFKICFDEREKTVEFIAK
jgi:hypothetical protein